MNIIPFTRFLRAWLAFAAIVKIVRKRRQGIASSTWLTRIWLVLVAVVNVVRRRIKSFAESIRTWLISDRVGNKTIEIDAWDVVEKYGATLRCQPKYSVSLIRDVSELPYPKAAIKAVLQDAFRRFPPNDALKTAYFSLADFQELTNEEADALAATSGLGLINSSADYLEGVYSRREKEQSALVQDLNSLRLRNEEAESPPTDHLHSGMIVGLPL